jgi:hypothetical protein
MMLVMRFICWEVLPQGIIRRLVLMQFGRLEEFNEGKNKKPRNMR